MFVLCVVSKDHKAICRTMKTKRKSMDEVQSKREYKKKIPPVTLISVSCECCVLSGRGLRDGPIPRIEKSHRMW